MANEGAYIAIGLFVLLFGGFVVFMFYMFYQDWNSIGKNTPQDDTCDVYVEFSNRTSSSTGYSGKSQLQPDVKSSIHPRHRYYKGDAGMVNTLAEAKEELYKVNNEEIHNSLPIGSKVSATVRRIGENASNTSKDDPTDHLESSVKHLESLSQENSNLEVKQDLFALVNIPKEPGGIENSNRVRKGKADASSSSKQTSSLKIARFRREDLIPPQKLRKGTTKRRNREYHGNAGQNVNQHLAQLKKIMNIRGLGSSTVKREEVKCLQNIQNQEPMYRFNPCETLEFRNRGTLIPNQSAAAPVQTLYDMVHPINADMAPKLNYFDQATYWKMDTAKTDFHLQNASQNPVCCCDQNVVQEEYHTENHSNFDHISNNNQAPSSYTDHVTQIYGKSKPSLNHLENQPQLQRKPDSHWEVITNDNTAPNIYARSKFHDDDNIQICHRTIKSPTNYQQKRWYIQE